MNEVLTYVHQHAPWVALGLAALTWISAKLDSPEEHAPAWVAGLSGFAAAAVFIWYLADPWIKDEDLVKPLGMIEMVQARLKLDPNDKAAQQAWQMIRDKMADVDAQTQACVFARKNLKDAPALALKVLAPEVDQSTLLLKLLDSATR